jgi:Bacterial archaeo-eukaryotic release factor family 11
VAAVAVEGMPEDAGRAEGLGEGSDWPNSPRPRLRASAGPRGAGGYWPSGSTQDTEKHKLLLRQFACKVDRALRPLLASSGVPLVLAAAEPLASIYHSVNSYPQLVDDTIEGSPEALTEGQLGERARTILDEVYRRQLADWRTLFEARANQGRATTNIAQAARAATIGGVASMLVDIDEVAPGRIEEDGAVAFAEQANTSNYDLIDEIATRIITTAGRVTGVRKADISRQAALASLCGTLCDSSALGKSILISRSKNLTWRCEMANPYINDQAARTEAATALSRLLADSYLIYLKTQGFH